MGSYFEKRGKGKYRLCVTDGSTSEGKRIVHRKTVTVESENEKVVYKLLFDFENEVSGTEIGSGKIKLDKFSELYLDFIDKNLSPKTVSEYKRIIEKRINKQIGHMKLIEIKPMDIMRLCDKVEKEGKARTAKLCFQVLSAMLTKAVYWQYIKENPCRRVEPPKYKQKEREIPKIDTIKKILRALENEDLKYQIFVHLILSTGMRPGEILGLEYKDIDFKNNTISINRTSQYIDKQIMTTDPKTEISKSVVDMPDYLKKMISSHKKIQAERQLKLGTKWEKTKRIFTTNMGGSIHPHTYQKWWPKFLEDNKFKHIRIYDLRHAYASLLLAGGLNYKEVANKMRHSTPAMVIKIYGHDIKERNKEHVNIIEEALK